LQQLIKLKKKLVTDENTFSSPNKVSNFKIDKQYFVVTVIKKYEKRPFESLWIKGKLDIR
jgi:hypothetical protein